MNMLLIQKSHHLLFHTVPLTSVDSGNSSSKLPSLDPNREGQGETQGAKAYG